MSRHLHYHLPPPPAKITTTTTTNIIIIISIDEMGPLWSKLSNAWNIVQYVFWYSQKSLIHVNTVIKFRYKVWSGPKV